MSPKPPKKKKPRTPPKLKAVPKLQLKEARKLVKAGKDQKTTPFAQPDPFAKRPDESTLKVGEGKKARIGWEILRRRFLAFEWLSYSEMREDLLSRGLKLTEAQIRHEAAKGSETWHDLRARLGREADEVALQAIRAILAGQIVKRTLSAVQIAELLDVKARETLGEKGVKLAPGEAIRAAKDSAEISTKLLGEVTKTGRKGEEDPEKAAGAIKIGEAGVVIFVPESQTEEAWGKAVQERKKRQA